MSNDESSLDSFKKLAAVYNRIITDEVRDHAFYARILVLTGLGLLVVGFVLAQYYFPLGFLLIAAGIIRTLNSIFDFQRGDSLAKKMRLVKREFDDILSQL